VTPADGAGIDRWDLRLLFLSRFLRLFGFGLLSIVLVLYLAELGLGPAAIGALLTLALLGDTLISLVFTTRADRVGRRRMLLAGAWLVVLAAGLLGAGSTFPVLLVATTIGVVSPSGNEVGPFLPIEQSALAQFVPAEQRTRTFAWYNLVGAGGTALGALCAGLVVAVAQSHGSDGAAAYRPVVLAYGVVGLLLVLCASRMSPRIEVRPGNSQRAVNAMGWGLGRSRRVVLRLSALFALDAFGGGLVIQSVLAYWLHLRFDVDVGALGTLFFVANLLSGLSHLAAARLAARIGLVNTMVFTHLPANLLLMLVPLAPGFGAAATLLLLRALVTQMDVPTRQAYLMAVVAPDERSAAAGITGVARSIGAALAPFLGTVLASSAAFGSLPFVVGGALKVVYDLLLYRGFVNLRPDHERRARG
jgi:MFS family permease